MFKEAILALSKVGPKQVSKTDQSPRMCFTYTIVSVTITIVKVQIETPMTLTLGTVTLAVTGGERGRTDPNRGRGGGNKYELI